MFIDGYSRMTKDELISVLAGEIGKYSDKPFNWFVNLDSIYSYELDVDGKAIQFEMQILEHTDQYIHVGISADDGSLMFSTLPVSRSFLVYKDGRVEK